MTRSRRFRALATAATLGVLALTLSGCSWSEALGLGWPQGITPEGRVNRELWIGSVVAALVVGVIVFGLTFWTAAFHRKKATDTDFPRQFGYNMPLEIVLTVIPFLIISVLFYFTVLVQERVTAIEKDPEVVVDVTAFQWNWKFGYQKVNFNDGTFGPWEGLVPDPPQAESRPPAEGAEGSGDSGHERVGAIAGRNPEDRSYLNWDRVETVGTTQEIPVLVLPVGKRIEFQLASADVIHSFWPVEFNFKRDVMPNPKQNNSQNVFQVEKIDKTGAFVGRCAELCGTYHAMMNFEVRVVEPNLFVTYLEGRERGLTNAQALDLIGEEPYATTTKPFPAQRGELASQASK
ncbi:cytochrome c oxidase subunit II [Mycobacterium sp. MYCO198283]|uniref:aa3-type cytochrome oxidase subunit II n=1 Tax=Mycobacterium sp. MYCO198283 TaxID=2883505 RepID=UPI001E48992D|nr:cytochrome c oxidase subunit II [Mycobacterium sp. MYCO198283]MCG5432692.1 cytochrome c oxidase subunit II [Mycobacterium sp. MYCO198283]